MKFAVAAAVVASFIAVPAFAAELGVVSQPAPIGFESPSQNWTGFYAGVFGGVAMGEFEYTATDPAIGTVPLFDVNGGGGIAGLQVGADYQFDQFVVGAVADIALSNHRADLGIAAGGLAGLDLSTRLTHLGTVRARAGFAFDNLLAYAHGGAAFGGTEMAFSAGGAVLLEGESDRVGFTVGAGIEYAVTENISLQTEYAYTGFKEESVIDLAPGTSFNEALSLHTVKAGVNFRF